MSSPVTAPARSLLAFEAPPGSDDVTVYRARRCVGAAVLGLVLATRVYGATVTVVWDPNSEPDLTGYDALIVGAA